VERTFIDSNLLVINHLHFRPVTNQ